MRYLFVYIAGLVLLLTAILANIIAKTFDLVTWYDVLVSDQSVGIIDVIWLTLIYPFILGSSAAGFDKYWNKVRRKNKADKKD